MGDNTTVCVTSDRLLNVLEVAAFLGVCKRTIYRWVHRGLFPDPIDLNGTMRWRDSTVKAWVASRTPGQEGGGNSD